MPAYLDTPVPGTNFDSERFLIRGWAWLEDRHADLVAVEAWSGDVPLGGSNEFHPRPDIASRYGLPADARTGFSFTARHPTAVPHEPFHLKIRARLRDGSHTPPLFTRMLVPPPPERHPFQMLRASIGVDARGLEIGAHTEPVAGLSPFYTDIVASYSGVAGRVDFLSDARALPLADETLDYLCSSHVLEHLPDPIAALHEWHRVLRPGGLLYLVVPDKRFTFDAPRATTTVEHFLRDFREGTSSADAAAHVDDFVFQADWSILSPNTQPAERASQQAAARTRYLHELEQGRTIDIHYHTFTPDSMYSLLRAAGFIGGPDAGFKLLAHADRYPPGRDDGIGFLLCKVSPSADEAAPETFALTRTSTAHGNAMSLPLVCPLSLSPLRAETSASGERVLVTATSGQRYPFVAGRPSLVPSTKESPRRLWADRSWREARPATILTPAMLLSQIPLLGHIDEPEAAATIDPLCFFVRGWVWLGPSHGSIAAVEAWVDGVLAGHTAGLFERPDVTAVHVLPADARTGFEIFAHHPSTTPGSAIKIDLRARFRDGTLSPVVLSTTVATIARDYRRNHFGILLDQRTTAIQGRANVFAEGPSSAEPNPEVALLLRRHLGSPPRRIIDVGCGLASYGRGLIADGYDWLGVEVDAADCAELARLGLPHQQVDGRTLPFADASFDAALCLEVLEHIEDPHAFLAEVQRVAPRQLIVSVPNCELLGYLWDHLAVPWHMLEADHKNFFTRWSLGGLLRQYYANVELRFHSPYPLRTVEGTPLHYHLFAVATA